MDEKEVLYKKILFVILIIIIFVSILGTWTVLNYIDNIKRINQPNIQGNIVVPLPGVQPDSISTISVDIKENPNLKNNNKKRSN